MSLFCHKLCVSREDEFLMKRLCGSDRAIDLIGVYILLLAISLELFFSPGQLIYYNIVSMLAELYISQYVYFSLQCPFSHYYAFYYFFSTHSFNFGGGGV